MEVSTEVYDRLYWAKELAKCEASYLYLAQRYLRVKSRIAVGFPTLKLNPIQTMLHEKVTAQWKRDGWVRQIWGKPRQIGASTYVLSLFFQRTAFQNYHNAFIVSYDEDTAAERFDTIATFYDALPTPLQPPTRYKSKFKIEFDGRRSRFLAGHSKNVNVGAGEMNHLIHLTEVARYSNPDEVQASLFPTISKAKGKQPSIVIMESTAFFGGDWFKNFAEAAQRGETEYEFTFVPWSLNPEYSDPIPPHFEVSETEKDLMRKYGLSTENIAWRRRMLATYAAAGNPFLFYQEYPLDFDEAWQSPKGTFRTFPDEVIVYLQSTLKPGMTGWIDSTGFHESLSGPIEQWQPPVEGAFYDIGIDVAGGHETGDWTVLEVIRRDTLEQVAEARGHWNPADSEFLDLVYWTGLYYNRAQLIPDITGGWGYALLNDLQKRDYPNLWQWRRRDDLMERPSKRIGFLYNRREKASLVTNAVRVVQRDKPLVHSEGLYEELQDFLNVGIDEWAARSGGFDDRVNAWMLALLAACDERKGPSPESLMMTPETPPPWAYMDVDEDLFDRTREMGDFLLDPQNALWR
jgi:hypothetical protein